MSDVLLSERAAEHVQLITLNRPDRLNALSAELSAALHEEFERVGGDRSCRAIVLTGAGRGFCAGVDLGGYGQAPGNDGTDPARDHLGNQEHMSRLILRLRSTPQPVIAAVNGPAAGFGLALALGSDIRYAAQSAVFRAAFINIGVSNCDMGTSWLLPRLIGASRAHELMLTGRKVDADEAERIGLVAGVVDDDGLIERALEAAGQIAAWSPWGIRLTKQGMWTALEIPSEQAAVEYEDRQQIMAVHGRALGRPCRRSSRSARRSSRTRRAARAGPRTARAGPRTARGGPAWPSRSVGPEASIGGCSAGRSAAPRGRSARGSRAHSVGSAS